MALLSTQIASCTVAGLLCTIFMVPTDVAAQVPFVGCKSDGQLGPQPAPKSTGNIPAVPKGSAGKLAYYKSRDLGVIAPRGWHCFGTYGSDGATLYVTPESHSPAEMFRQGFKLTGTAVQLTYSLGGTSGRFEVARVAARLFPTKKDFVQQVIDEDIEPKEEFQFGPYPADIVKRRSDLVVEYKTPAAQDGMGTQSLLAKSSSPIEGIAIMTDEDNLVRLAVRVPPDMESLVPAIIEATAATFATKPSGQQ